MYKWVKYICSVVGVACVAIVLSRYVCISFTYVLKTGFLQTQQFDFSGSGFFWTSITSWSKFEPVHCAENLVLVMHKTFDNVKFTAPFLRLAIHVHVIENRSFVFFPSYKAFFVQVSVSCTHALTIWYPAVNLGNLALSDLIHSISMKWQFWSNSSLFFLYGEISLHRQSSVT